MTDCKGIPFRHRIPSIVLGLPPVTRIGLRAAPLSRGSGLGLPRVTGIGSGATQCHGDRAWDCPVTRGSGLGLPRNTGIGPVASRPVQAPWRPLLPSPARGAKGEGGSSPPVTKRRSGRPAQNVRGGANRPGSRRHTRHTRHTEPVCRRKTARREPGPSGWLPEQGRRSTV